LVDRLGALGFKLGLWCGAFWMCSAVKEGVARMGDAMLRRDGEPVVASPEWSYGAAGLLPRGKRPCLYSLDPTHPKTRALLRRIFRTYRKWGIRYFMVDFLNAVSGSTPGHVTYDDYHDRSLIKGPQVLRRGLEVVREAAGPDTYLLSSSGPTLQNVGCVDACRVGSDYGEGRALNPESYFYPATFVINSAEFWTSHRYASDNMAATYFTHRKLYLNDSGNVLTLDKPMPLCEAYLVATIFGLGGGPVMLGDDIDRISEERLALIKKVFPRTPEVAKPVDLFDSPAPDYPKLFHRRVAAAWGEWDIVGVLNYGSEPLVLPVALSRLGLGPAGRCRLWEFWDEQYRGTVTGEFRATVPPHSARLYRLAAARAHPWVLSTDMHVMQGETELREVRWDEETMTLSGRATRPAGETGNLFVHAPPGLRVENPRGHWIAKDAAEGSLIIRCRLDFGEAPAEWSLRFAPI
jgi:alpha-galactosidase